MKSKISISIDEENIQLIEKAIEDGMFRNRSHAVEFAIEQILEMILNEKKEAEK